MKKSLIIIGAGIGGLAAGCYARMNDYETTVFEMHNLPGGVCTSWKRKGYIFDGCIHHLAGCAPGSAIYGLWEELGVMPGLNVLFPEDLVSVEEPGGKKLTLFVDLEKLEQHVKELAPGDSKLVEQYVKAASAFTRFNMLDLIASNPEVWLRLIPSLPAIVKWNSISLEKYATRFSDPFLRKAIPTLQYDNPIAPVGVNLNMLAGCSNGYFGWPAGGSLEFARSMEKRYLDLGGVIEYKSRVEKILVEGDRAIGVRLADGTEHRAGYVISNAYGKTTIFDMLGGCYTSKSIRSFYDRPKDEVTMGIHVHFGLDRDLSDEPHAIVLFLEEAVEIAGQSRDRLDLELFAFDPSMAPSGKSVLKAVLETSYSYWRELYGDRERYKEEKSRVADIVSGQLERRFPCFKEQVEVVDVATPMTTERYTGNSCGFEITPGHMLRAGFSKKGFRIRLPGLDNFYMVGQWAGFPSLPNVAVMGRTAIKMICRRDGKRFVQNAGTS